MRVLRTTVLVAALGAVLTAGGASAASSSSATVQPYPNGSGVRVEKSTGYFSGIWVCSPQQPRYVEVIDLNGNGSSTLPPGAATSPVLISQGPTPNSFRTVPT